MMGAGHLESGSSGPTQSTAPFDATCGPSSLSPHSRNFCSVSKINDCYFKHESLGWFVTQQQIDCMAVSVRYVSEQ